jgi:hypothetical protein
MGKNKGQFKKGRGPFNFSHDKVKEEKTGIYGSWIYNYLCNQSLSLLKL